MEGYVMVKETIMAEVERPWYMGKERFFKKMKAQYEVSDDIFVGSWKDPKCKVLQIWKRS